MKKRVVFVSMAAAALLTACGGTQKSETTTAQTTVQTTAEQSIEAQTTAGSAENTSSTQTVDKQKVYVSAEWVKFVIDGKQPESSDYKIIEVAWGKESDDKAYTKGHIPGAYHLNTDDLESDKDWNLRTPEEIGKLLASYGITKDTTVSQDITLPTGITSANVSTISVEVKFGAGTTKTISGVPINYKNNVHNYKATQSDNITTMDVEVFGTQDNISKINENDIYLYIDMSTAEPGLHEFEVKVEQPTTGLVKYSLKNNKLTLTVLGDQNTQQKEGE